MHEVTATQAAALTGLSERTIRRRIAAGELPARHVAPNRYAINVRDLPARGSNSADLATRLDTLERRVHVLEIQQRVLARARDAADGGVKQIGTEAAGDAGAEVERLHDLLLQLEHEAERLTPLLAIDGDGRREDEPGAGPGVLARRAGA